MDYVIPPKDEEENSHSAASTEQVDEEIEIEADASLHQVSSPPVHVTDEETDEDVDVGSSTPVIDDDLWDVAHPNSPLTTPLTQVPQSPAITEEIQTGSEGHQPSLQTINEEIPAASAK